ncbi:hypothetical protein KR018_006023 [Drosophila ironensis]|nr:hypothetical protein KR018_006023 [Drosophila ironensis]
MSVRSLRKSRASRKSPLPDEVGHMIYCVHFYDNGLKAVQEEFVKRAATGTRRAVFVIDLEKEISEARYFNSRYSSMKNKGMLLPMAKSEDPLIIALQGIANCIVENERVNKALEAAVNFDLYRYWQKNVPAQLKNLTTKAPNTAKQPKTAKGGSDKMRMQTIQCTTVSAKEHHKVGKGEKLNTLDYIKDNPPTVNMLILIVGQMKNDFYKKLMAYEQPLKAIIHFLPEESGYDLLVPRPRRERELMESVAGIQRDIYSVRKRIGTKSVGIFQQQLPQMSACLAAKHSDDVFDQLSWYMYDVESLREWYRRFYLECYKETNVKMDPQLQMLDAFHVAESLSIQGHYLKSHMPASRDDDCTIYLYMESLMSTFGNPRELMTDTEVLLLANPSPAVQTRILDKVKVYANAFKSIVKLPKNDRVFVEGANILMSSLLSYMDQTLMRNIYHGCLEYNIIRRYFTHGYITNAIQVEPYNGDPEPLYLPKFAQLYLTDDSVMQRLIQLVNDFDDYTVEEIHPNIQLFTFRQGLNEVFEQEKQTVIPTRLCFRDFTLFEMEQFLKDLVTPEMYNEINADKMQPSLSQSTLNQFSQVGPIMVTCGENRDRVPIDPTIFVRPKSLKGKQNKKDELPKDGHPSEIGSASYEAPAKSIRPIQSQKSNVSTKSVDVGPGLNRNHPMLKGYNLDDTRQTIKAKTSKYFFQEGRMTLYEEKWNFRQMNKCLSLEVGGQQVHLRSPSSEAHIIDPSVRIQSKNGISLRVMPKEAECAKAVLNFPNGLTTYCHDTHAEHIWQYQDNDLDESRRVCTPYGCVIVFYQNTETVLIMRYNGEVYHLFSVLEADNEEEEEMISEFLNACSTQSNYSSYKPVPSEERVKCTKRPSRQSGGGDTVMRPSTQSKQSLASKGSFAGSKKSRQVKNKQFAALFASIEYELIFLNFIMALYKLSYRHLKLITSLGSVVHVQYDGKIWCGKPFRNSEWHDYYANEAYSMRDDGVKMIWSEDGMRCYHSDGTCIKTGCTEGWEPGDDTDEIDIEITDSSSHLQSESDFKAGTIYINVPTDMSYVKEETEGAEPGSPAISLKAKTKGQSITEFLMEEFEEAGPAFDMSYITYMTTSFGVYHEIYPSIMFVFSYITKVDLNIETSVCTCDNMMLRVFKDAPLPEVQLSPTESEQKFFNEIYADVPSSSADSDEWTRHKTQRKGASDESPDGLEEEVSEPFNLLDRNCVEVECENLKVYVWEDRAAVQTELGKFGCVDNAKCGQGSRNHFDLEIIFTESLSNIFQKWIAELNRFLFCYCPKWRTVYFMQVINSECQRKAFEFMKTVPPMGKYNLCSGNFFIDAAELLPVSSRMKNSFDWFDRDMEKFPRFPPFKKTPPGEKFPMVLNAKIYVEIPAQLANTDRIHLFVNEFDRIRFRKQRFRFNEVALFHLHPRLHLMVQQEISKRSWKNRHNEMKRRKFMEQQRMSLYMAMLKHKVYPNYFQFKDNFNSHVRNIDFFNFMSAKCNEKAHIEEPVVDHPVDHPEPTSEVSSRKSRKKCYCPKYTKSLT